MFVSREFKRIKIRAKTPIAKPCNGSARGGNVSNLLLLQNHKEGSTYLVKGLKGLLNHAMMAVAEQKGLEVCHTSEKTETQSGEKTLPNGFHANGACYPKGECIKHRLMGSIKKQSRLRFEPVVIVSDNIKGTVKDAQKMHIATENRNVLMHKTKKGIQDFSERYIAGEFVFAIELLEEFSQEELAFLLKSILFMPELRWGGAGNNGAGKLQLLEVHLQHVTRIRTIKKGTVFEEEQEENLWNEMEEVLRAW